MTMITATIMTVMAPRSVVPNDIPDSVVLPNLKEKALVPAIIFDFTGSRNLQAQESNDEQDLQIGQQP